MGKAKYGKDGAIEKGSVNTKCTYPPKRYTKSLDLKVKASIDSVVQLPTQNLDLGLTQTVTRLADYTSDGLDLDLILFRICEISLNKGFTAEQTDHLTQVALDTWSKKNPVSSNN